MAAVQSHVSTGRAALDQPTVETNDVGPKMLALLHKYITRTAFTGALPLSSRVVPTNYELHMFTLLLYVSVVNER